MRALKPSLKSLSAPHSAKSRDRKMEVDRREKRGKKRKQMRMEKKAVN